MPVQAAAEMISAGTCSEMDIVLDLWISTIYNDKQVQGSGIGPVVYLRNGTGNPLVTYSELAIRYGISKSTVGRILKKLEKLEYLSLMSFPGRSGSVIYLKNYLSTMFQISDIMIDKEEVAMELNIKLGISEEKEKEAEQGDAILNGQVIVPEGTFSVSTRHIEFMVQKIAEVLSAQGISCFECSQTIYKLYPLSNACREDIILRGREPARWEPRQTHE